MKINSNENLYDLVTTIENKDECDRIEQYYKGELAMIISFTMQHTGRKWVSIVTYKHGELVTIDVDNDIMNRHVVNKLSEMVVRLGYKFVTCEKQL